MPLSPGDKLGPYEILAPIGAGGMGEVYRARDTRLDRVVAIKILPAVFSADRERLHRFEREARLASCLNHPNIVTIHELGRDGSTHYLTMELVNGRTLTELLAASALPIRTAIELAAQVAEGLAKAHEAGIAHRDLKPGNVMVSDGGFVKILDFGLAKLAPPSSGVADTRSSSGWGSQPGQIVGTPQYMSPEQASNSPADFRSDQFSFGLVLYEMVTVSATLFGDFASRPSGTHCGLGLITGNTSPTRNKYVRWIAFILANILASLPKHSNYT